MQLSLYLLQKHFFLHTCKLWLRINYPVLTATPASLKRISFNFRVKKERNPLIEDFDTVLFHALTNPWELNAYSVISLLGR